MFVLDISNALMVGPTPAPSGHEDRLKKEDGSGWIHGGPWSITTLDYWQGRQMFISADFFEW